MPKKSNCLSVRFTCANHETSTKIHFDLTNSVTKACLINKILGEQKRFFIPSFGFLIVGPINPFPITIACPASKKCKRKQ